jgi:superfamily II DNA/RNA helicase
MSFSDLGLSESVLRAVADAGYTEPTPIQAQAIPHVLMGRDILGCAQTGTGKTASFTLPMIDILGTGKAKARMPRSLILEPTRELAAQVAENFDTYGKYVKLSKALLIGGESMDKQIKVIDRGPDVLIATPGRLLDLFERGRLLMTDVKILVIDEADRMLDMGFIPDVERIVSLLSPIRTTLFFSATMPPEIRRLADKFLMNPKEISVSKPASTADTIEQGLVMLEGEGGRKPRPGETSPGMLAKKRAALRALIDMSDVKNALVFCNRKRDVGVVFRSLERHGYNAGQLHGDMVQSVRTETLEKFKSGEISILVCSDVAARGLDISTVSHVFNFDLPTHAEDYVHRIGRTGRAGRTGHAYAIATQGDDKYLAEIERIIGKAIPQITVEGVDTRKAPATASTPARVAAKASDETADAKPDAASDDKPDGEREGGRSKRRRGGRKRKDEQRDESAPRNAAERAAQTPETDDAPDATDAPKTKRDARPEKQKKRRESNDDEPVVGLGDHVPAFLMRGT